MVILIKMVEVILIKTILIDIMILIIKIILIKTTKVKMWEQSSPILLLVYSHVASATGGAHQETL